MANAPNTKAVLGLIPAKAGSVRLPGKNTRYLAGKTLLERTVLSARKSGICDRLFVSTESEEIAGMARGLGVDVPFLRPEQLARDPAGVVEVALHVLDEWERRGEHYDAVVILLPTSPFRRADDIIGAMDAYRRLGVNFLMSVSREVHSPLSSLVMDSERLLPLHPEWLNRTGARSSGDLPVLVRCNGAVTVVDVASFRKERNYYAYPLGAYEMPVERSLDVDTEMEFEFAEFLASKHPEWLDD
ncbi:MAG: acylneuraminate cytidylyltransferase family protein [Nitrosomonadales bacterium]|nr:MAG: acylneuraminate cytidylyltransferase family protein [Nitrosomonadales bacterium]